MQKDKLYYSCMTRHAIQPPGALSAGQSVGQDGLGRLSLRPAAGEPNEMVLTIAATYIQDYHFRDAEQWLNKISDVRLLTLDRNPFGAPLLHRLDTLYPFDKGHFSRIRFAREMAALLEKKGRQQATAADLYKLATGCYNMTCYGRAWATVKFFRPSTEGYGIPAKGNPFQKEYYGCLTAERYFRKAINASRDRNFKARRLFMMARCSQKQIQSPEFNYRYPENWGKTEKAAVISGIS